MNRPEGVEQISIVRSFLLLPQAVAPLVGQGWTLVHELYFYFIFAFTLPHPEKARWRLLGIWTGVIIAGFILTLHFPGTSPIVALSLHPMTLEFLAGCAIARLIQRGYHDFSKPALALAALTFFVTTYFPADWQPMLLYMIPAVFAVYGATAIETRHRFHFPKWLCSIGDVSYSVYLSHMLPISLTRRVFAQLHLAGVFFDALFVCISAGFVLAVGFACYRYLEKPLLGLSYAFTQRFFLSHRSDRK
jgi:peptidoglycan/LPS O-acetylase OafA/YrhL